MFGTARSLATAASSGNCDCGPSTPFWHSEVTTAVVRGSSRSVRSTGMGTPPDVDGRCRPDSPPLPRPPHAWRRTTVRVPRRHAPAIDRATTRSDPAAEVSHDTRSPNARSRHRLDRPYRHRSSAQGFSHTGATRRPRRHDRRRGDRQGACARRRHLGRPHARLCATGRHAGLQHGARRRRSGRHRSCPGCHGEPVLLVVAADDPHGGARHQGRRG